MAVKRGISSIFDVAQPFSGNNSLANVQKGVATLITPVRVTSIVLDETHPKFVEYGEWNGIGTIEFTSATSANPTSLRGKAVPLDPNNKSYPLINEIVYCLNLPNNTLGEANQGYDSYYINIVGLWNHPHHNAFPSDTVNLAPSQQKDYIQTEAGSARRVQDNSTEIYLGKTFVERANIHPLRPFEGDFIYEGRWGNSIRFGSTVSGSVNNWSTTGSNGDPITIFRNGQGIRDDKGWIPITENINIDDSSIYLTSTQQIPITVSSTNNYYSYTSNPPEFPNSYSGKQIILNSGRLVFNTTEDHLLLSSQKSINLSAVDSINIDTEGSTVIQSGEVLLGSKNATEPILLGETTVNLLRDLLIELADLSNALSNQTYIGPNGTPLPLTPTNTIALTVNTTVNNLINNLPTLTSNYVKTV